MSGAILPAMHDFGKALVILGVTFVAIGLLLWKTNALGWLGRLPGDIHVSGKNSSFHFPIVTCLVLSAILTLLAWLVRR